MFTEELSLPSSLFSNYTQPGPSYADLEFEICSTFLKHTGQRLSSQEAGLMEQSRRFLQAYAYLAHPDPASSRSLPLDSDNDPTLPLPHAPRKPPSRKPFPSQDYLAEVQQLCSPQCSAFFANLVGEGRRSGVRRVEGVVRSEGRLEEENAVLRKRL